MRIALLLVVLLVARPARAQSTRAELFGSVQDPGSLPVAEATVELRERATGIRRTTATAVDGSYSFTALAPGDYELEAGKPGFRTAVRQGIRLQIGDRVSLDLQLALGDVSESVAVNAAAPLLQSSRGTVSFNVEEKKVVTLPLDGRNFVPLIALSPGVNLPPGSTLPRINGSRPRVSEYIYDGISVLQPEPGQVAYFPVIDAIEEFRVETNSYSAEYGRSNGGVIMVNGKSGSNHLHGTLFEFFRNEALNARNFFAPAGPRPLFRRNQYGFVVGGPVQKNRSFFFVDWQGTRLASGVVRTSTVPTLAQRTPQPGWDPVAARLIASYPLPTSTAAANNYRRLGTDRTAQDQFDLRFDQYLGTAHRLVGRYAYLRDDSDPSQPLPSVTSNLFTRAGSLMAEDTWTLTPGKVNQFRFGFTRRSLDRASNPGEPSYDITGFQSLGPGQNTNGTFSTSVTQFIDNLAMAVGRHSIKVGADIRHERLDILQPPYPNGVYQFTSLAGFTSGNVQNFSIDIQNETLRPRANIAEFFFQDDFRATSRLSVNLGLRYTLNFPSTVVDDQGAVFNLRTEQLDFLGRNGNPRAARRLEWANFAPRLGFAWRLSESLVLRSGYGITWIEQAGITTPFTTPLFPFIRTVAQPSLDNLTPAFRLADGPVLNPSPPGPDAGLGQGVFGVQRGGRSGYAQQWNLSVQKTFGANWSAEIGYLGSKLTNLGVPDVNLNQLPVELLSLGPQLTQQVPNPWFGQVPVESSVGRPTVARQQLLRPYPRFTTVTMYRNNVGHSTYHSFQSRLAKRFSRGFTFTAAYTWSKLIDDAGAVFDAAVLTGPVTNYQAADSYNRRLEKDVSTGNIPHVFSFGGVHEWRGFQFAALARVQSGSPVAVTQTPNLNAFAGFGIQRPNRVGNPDLPSDQRSTSRWFDTSAFRLAPQFTIGNSSRNPVEGPGFRTLDLMVGKRIRFVELRAEAFNVTNSPSFGNPNGNFGTAAFGTVTSAYDPRVFELVAKLHF